MLDQINASLAEYYQKWQNLTDARLNQALFASMKPVALGWKVEDRAEYDRVYAMLHDDCDNIVETWMNGRWIAKLHLRDTSVKGGITIIKLMQRRPGSTDAIGLDHVDFYTSEADNGESLLANEPDLNWTHETNDVLEDYTWLSIWFDGTEAKLKNSTVLNNIIKELQIVNDRIIEQ